MSLYNLWKYLAARKLPALILLVSSGLLQPLGREISGAKTVSAADGEAPEGGVRTPRAPAAAAEGEEESRLRAEQMRVAQELYREMPGVDSAFVLGAVCLEQGDTAGAVRYWEEEVRGDAASTRRLHPVAQTWVQLAEVFQTQGEQDKAQAALESSLRLQPARNEARFRLARLHFARGNDAEALQTLGEPSQDGAKEGADRWTLRGQALGRLGRHAEARSSFERAVRADDTRSEAYYGLMGSCLRLGDTAAAAAARERFGSLKQREEAAGRERRARFDSTQTVRASVAQTHTQAGWVYQARGQAAMAERVWREAGRIDPLNTACRFHLLMLLKDGGRNEEALAVCREMIAAEPQNASHRLALGNLWVRLGRIPEARTAYEQAAALAPGRAEVCFALGQFYLRTDPRPALALEWARRAVALAPAAPHFYLLSRAWERNGDRDQALVAIQRACALEPDNDSFLRWHKSLQPTR